MSAQSRCPKCNSEDYRCKDSRPSHLDDVVRRRVYWCGSCGHRVGTHEVIVSEVGKGASSTEAKMLAFLIDVESAMDRAFGGDLRLRASQIGRRLGMTYGAKK